VISRSTASEIIRNVEDALHHLLKASAVRYEADAEDPTREKLERMWMPTASASGLLMAITEAYPDLAGPDRQFRDPSKEVRPRRLEYSDLSSIRDHLSLALGLMRRIDAALRGSGEGADVDSERWALRYEESATVLEAMIQSLEER
jgi:hypothetical protein